MPMAKALKAVAPRAKIVRRALPTTFQQWTKAMSQIPTDRLDALDGSVIALLCAVAGLTSQQVLTGHAALRDELETR